MPCNVATCHVHLQCSPANTNTAIILTSSAENRYDSGRSRIVLLLETKNETLNKKHDIEQLKEMVPEYMLPGKVFCKAQFPYNMNGKVDRKQLRAEYIGD